MADAAGAAAALKAEGNKCLAAKDFDGAIAKYSEAIALDPANHVFYSNRSAAYLSKGDANSALADADKCIEVKPDWPKGYGRKGAAHHSLQQYEQAFDAYEKGLAVAPNDAALKKGMQSVEKAMLSSMPGGGGNPLAGLFNAANIERLRAHPTTGPFFEDPSFNQLMQNVGSNPNGMQLMQSDPRFLQCLQVLLQADPMMQQAQQQAQDEENRKKEAEVQATPKGYGSWAPKAKEAEPEEEEEELTAEELAEKEREAAAEAERQKVRDAADAKKAEVGAVGHACCVVHFFVVRGAKQRFDVLNPNSRVVCMPLRRATICTRQRTLQEPSPSTMRLLSWIPPTSLTTTTLQLCRWPRRTSRPCVPRATKRSRYVPATSCVTPMHDCVCLSRFDLL